MAFDVLLLGLAVLLLLSVAASKAAARLGVPALLLFLLIGMLAGSDGPGGIPFEDYQLTQSVGVVALTLILFAGGLDTDWRTVRPVLGPALALATVGVALTALLVGGVAVVALGFSPLEGALLGAIVSSTDAAAVFSVLRGRSSGLAPPLGELIELESGTNDPMAVFLTTGLIQQLISPSDSLLNLVPQFFIQMLLGTVLGLGLGRAMTLLINKSRLEFEGLYPVLSMALVLLTYGVTVMLGGNGFLAVYLAGLVLGNSNFVHRRSLLRFHDGLAWLMQIVMFLVLGLLVFPRQIPPIAGAGLLLSLFLILVARPLSVFVSLCWTRFDWRSKALIGWVGLRGAVPIVLATFPLLAGVPRAEMIFNLVFFIVVSSVLVQGTTLPRVARWLSIATATPSVPSQPLAYVPAIDLSSQVSEIRVAAGSAAVDQSILELGLPNGALVVLIGRDGETLVPNGGTVLHPDDLLVIVATPAAAAAVRTAVGAPEPDQPQPVNKHARDAGPGSAPTQ